MPLEVQINSEHSLQQIESAFENIWQEREVLPSKSLTSLRQLEKSTKFNSVQKAKAAAISSFHHGREFRFNRAADSALEALEKLTRQPDDLWLARSHGRLAIALHSLGDLTTASLEFKRQVVIAKKGIKGSSLFREELFLGYFNAGCHFYRVADIQYAEKYYKKCYSLTDESDFQFGFLLSNHAQCLTSQSKYPEACEKALKALEIGQRLGVDRILVYSHEVLADISMQQDKTADATRLLLEGCEIAVDAKLSPIRLQLSLVRLYLEKQQYENASKLLKQMESPKDVIDHSKFCLLKSNYYESTRKYKRALAFHKRYLELHEQILDLNKRDQAHAASIVQRIRLIERKYQRVRKKNAKLKKSIQSVKAAHREVKVLAETDPLTNLNNRRQFLVIANAVLQLAQESAANISLAIVDIDNFKGINDSHGHLVGDEVLKALASMSTDILRESDIMGRFGGEEFIVLMPDTGLQAANDAMERFRNHFECYDWENIASDMKVTFSCGLAQSDHKYDFSVLLAEADKNLYVAKDQGRNLVVCNSG